MFELGKILMALITPPLNTFLLVIIAYILYKMNFKKLAKTTSAFAFILLYILSIPFTFQLLNNHLMEDDQRTVEEYQEAQAIVILGGGLRQSNEIYANLVSTAPQLERLRYAAYLQKVTKLPLLATGSSPSGASEGQIIANELQEFFNVPTKWVESKARNTKENALYSKELLEKDGVHKIILVTNQWHMQRAKMLFEQLGFEVLPASVGMKLKDEEPSSINYFIPNLGSLNSNMVVLKEWIGYFKELKLSSQFPNSH